MGTDLKQKTVTQGHSFKIWLFEVLCGFVAQTASLRWTN